MAACSGSSDSPAVDAAQAPTTTTPPAGSSPTTAATSSLPPPTVDTVPVRKVNVNSASQSEIQTALQDAGVPNPAQWAREVVEYRPYPTSDPTLPKLRQNLVRYNPGPRVVDAIVSALSV